MSSRRLSAVALFLLAFAGCHEDPTVLSVAVVPSVEALTFFASGGTASSAAGVDGLGGDGGSFTLSANGLISLGSPAFVPSAPALPTAPTTFDTIAAAPLPALTTANGHVHVSGNLTTAVVATATVNSDNGDIVFDGLLQSANNAGTMTNIVFTAPNGTVYINGTIRTAGTDSLSDGQSAGTLTVTAARIVITGSIDAHGVANTMVAGGNGGAGGAVNLRATQGPVLFTAGSINTSGGAVTETAGNAGVQGGAGGAVSFNFVGGVNAIEIFAPITTDGGAVTSNGATPQAGDAGLVIIKGAGSIDLATTVSMQGGAATGNANTAAGGDGGALTINGPAACKIYGTLLLGGGSAFASTTGGAVTGGKGGSVSIGQTLPTVNSIEMGQGDFTLAGGTGGLSTGIGGGKGGSVAVESIDGDVTVGSSLVVKGGTATGAGNAGGGDGGSVSLITDNQAASTSNHIVSVPSLASALDATGGAGLGTGAGGKGGTVYLQCGGDLTSGARINVSGGASVSGKGGDVAFITPAVGSLSASSAVVLRVASAGPAANGGLSVSGTIQTQGGTPTTAGIGGNGADIAFQISAGNGALTSTATLTTSGGNGFAGIAGTSGSIFVFGGGGDVTLAGVLTTNGASSQATPSAAGDITVQGTGPLTSSATYSLVGGASTDPAGLAGGAAGGDIKVDGQGGFSPINILSGSSFVADGGAAPGANVATLGGAGGTITMLTRGQPVSMSGGCFARGGAVSGIGTGGPGGQLLVSTDSTSTGIAGNITLQSDCSVDMSGGSGSILGPARRNGVAGDPFPAAGSPAVLAVILDANDDVNNTGGTVLGKVQNLGSITATGFTGGDIYFHGLNVNGVALSGTDGGVQNISGATVGRFFAH